MIEIAQSSIDSGSYIGMYHNLISSVADLFDILVDAMQIVELDHFVEGS